MLAGGFGWAASFWRRFRVSLNGFLFSRDRAGEDGRCRGLPVVRYFERSIVGQLLSGNVGRLAGAWRRGLPFDVRGWRWIHGDDERRQCVVRRLLIAPGIVHRLKSRTLDG